MKVSLLPLLIAVSLAAMVSGCATSRPMKGIGHSKLAETVVQLRTPRLRGVPTYLSVEQEEKFLASFNRAKPKGKRDFAMAMCMIRLGLRGSETEALRLDDIDWKNGVIAIHNRKCRRVDRLPLLAEVGAALEDYLLKGRPKSDAQHVFLKVKLGPEILKTYPGREKAIRPDVPWEDRGFPYAASGPVQL